MLAIVLTRSRVLLRDAYLLLLNQNVIWHVINDTLAENWGGETGISFLSIDFRELSVENKVVSFWTEGDSHFGTEEDKGEAISIL